METIALSPVLGVIVKFAVQYLRDNPNIPWLTPEMKKKTLVIAGALSALSGLVIAILNGSLSQDTVNTLINALLTAFMTFGSSVTFHEVTKEQR